MDIQKSKGLDYALIRQMLEELYAVYPGRKYWKEIPCLAGLSASEALSLLSYLDEHNMISVPMSKALGGQIAVGKMTITARGIDFLQPDGGLSALAGPVIRIAPDSIIAIIDEALAARDIPTEERSAIKKSLGVAGEEGIRVVVSKLIEAGMAHAPDLIRIFGLS